MGVALTYDTDKTLGENLSYISGDLLQGSISSTVAKGGLILALSTVEAPALLVFGGGFAINETLKYFGIDLGKEAQAVYAEYTTSLVEMELSYLQLQQEYPELFNDDGSLIGDNTQLSLNGNIIEKYDGLTKALEDNNVDTTGLKGLLDRTKEIQTKVDSFESQLQEKLPEIPNSNSKIEIEYNNDNSIEIKKPDNTRDIIADNIKTTYDIDNNQVGSIPLKSGQTISHIAQKTEFNSIDLLEYNNLTLEEAKSLPVGYKVLVPKEKPINIEGEYGTIKLFGNHDDTFTARFPDEQNNKTNITFTDKETFQSWEKDDNRIMYLKELSSDDFDISFKIENGKKVLDSIEIKALGLSSSL